MNYENIVRMNIQKILPNFDDSLESDSTENLK